MKMKALLFDVDGTLLSEEPLVNYMMPIVYEELAKKLGINREKARKIFLQEVQRRWGRDEWFSWNFFFTYFGLDLKYEDFIRENPHLLRVYPEVTNVLQQLKSRVKLAIVTSGPAYQRLKLEVTGLLNYFQVVITRDESGVVKPDPKAFIPAIEVLGVNPSETAVVGDSLEWDILGAKSLGMKGVWINRRGEKGYHFPDFEFPNLLGLLEVMK